MCSILRSVALPSSTIANDILCNANTNNTTNSCKANFGGIVGIVLGGGSITGCENSGAIGSDPDKNTNHGNLFCCLGGIVGRIASSNFTIRGCTNNGTIYHTGNQQY